MNRVLLTEMRKLAEAGDKRKNAATTLLVTAIEMSKQAEALKTASKAYASAASQLQTIFGAAHEMTDGELKDFKKLHDHVEDTIESLKKHTGYAALNATEMNKLASELNKDIPFDRIPPEPDPDRPLVKGPPIPKPNFSSEEWGLESKSGVNSVVVELNKAAWKVIDALDDELPHLKRHRDVYNEMSAAFEKYLKPLLKKYGADFSAKDSTGRLVLFQQVMSKMNDWAHKLTGDQTLKWLWKPSPKYVKPEPKPEPVMATTWKSVWKK